MFRIFRTKHFNQEKNPVKLESWYGFVFRESFFHYGAFFFQSTLKFIFSHFKFSQTLNSI